MARPKKQTVEYFPHDCEHKTTMYIIEQKYGNDGYAFWFKLLEILGKEDGHYLDLRDEMKWEFLQAKTHLDEITTCSLLDLLAKLNAIDPELWEQKIVWSDNFISRLKTVYMNRRVETPTKPTFLHVETPTIQPFLQEETHKVKESKVKESKSNIVNTTISPEPEIDPSEFDPQKDAPLKKEKEQFETEDEKKELQETVKQVMEKHPRFAMTLFLGNHTRDDPVLIVETLKELCEAENIQNPYAYCEAVFKIKTGRVNARQEEAEHEQRKRPTGTEMETLGAVMQRAIAARPP